jgi:hypothetical protein
MTSVEKLKGMDVGEIKFLLWEACISLNKRGDWLMAQCLPEFVAPILAEAALREPKDDHAAPF